MTQKDYLIYDAQISGHHSDYFRVLYNYVKKQTDLSVTFMVPHGIQNIVKIEECSNISFRFLAENELEKIAASNLINRSLYELKLVRDELNRIEYKNILLLYMDYFWWALMLSSMRVFPSAISGIVFVPYPRLTKVLRQKKKIDLKLAFKIFRKKLQMTAILFNPHVKNIFILSDEHSIRALNENHKTSAKFVFLPEPYLDGPQPDQGINIRELYSLDAKTNVVLVFGSIIPRKNVNNIIKSFATLAENVQKTTALLILGNAKAAYREELEILISDIKTQNKYVNVVFDCRFVETSVLNAAVAQSSVVVLPYREVYQSSGVFFVAANYKKPVVVSDLGLLGELTQNNQLGATVDVDSVTDIGEKIEFLMSDHFSYKAESHFFHLHTPENFAKVLLGRSIAEE